MCIRDSFEGQRAFVESLVHDFKNPIAVVHVNLAWLSDRIGTDDVDLCEAISDAKEGINRLQKMVDDLLMVGMLEQSSLPLKREFIHVTDLLDEAMTVSYTHLRAHETPEHLVCRLL